MDAAGHRVAKTEGREFVNSAALTESELGIPIERGLAPPANCELVSPDEGYARWAPLYDTSLNPLLAREERYLAPLLRNVHRRKILDLACGTGRWIEKILSQGGVTSAVGFDCSAPMLRVANQKRQLTGKLARAACESLPFRTEAFDLAICSFALGHVDGLECMTRELARVMRVGSDVFVSDLHPEAYARGWRVGFRNSTAAFQIEMIPRSSETVVHAFSSTGFECLKYQSLHLGDAEKAIFESAGKSGAFADACSVPAVLVYHFKRLASPPAGVRQ